MVVTDIQACFVVGACIADLSAPALASAPEAQSFGGGDVYARSRHRAFLYPALFLGPSATLFMLAWPGWESQYLHASFVETEGRFSRQPFLAPFCSCWPRPPGSAIGLASNGCWQGRGDACACSTLAFWPPRWLWSSSAGRPSCAWDLRGSVQRT